MTRQLSPWNRAARIALPAALALAMSGHVRAQDAVNDFKLPPKSAPAPQGPVDSDAPVVVPGRPTSEPASEPAPTVAPTATATPTVAASPIPAAPQRARSTAPAPRQTVPLPDQAPPSPLPAETPAPAPAETAVATSAPATPVPPAEAAIPFRSALPFIALGMALMLAGAAFALSRSQRPDRRNEFVPEPISPPLPPPAIEPAPPPPPAPLPTPAFATARLTCDFTARTLQLSMMTATLDYRLTLANPGSRATGPLVVRADLSFAHTSLGAREQLEPRERKLEPRHEHPGLAPGEMAEFAGKLALPLAQIQPVRHGRALLFAPLARFMVRSPQGSETYVFTLGEDNPRGGGLLPIRLDLGPRGFARLATRAIDTQAWLAADPLRQAG